MSENSYNLNEERDKLLQNINQMCLSEDTKSLMPMYDWAKIHLDRIFNFKKLEFGEETN